jgi:hypothetical protein
MLKFLKNLLYRQDNDEHIAELKRSGINEAKELTDQINKMNKLLKKEASYLIFEATGGKKRK